MSELDFWSKWQAVIFSASSVIFWRVFSFYDSLPSICPNRISFHWIIMVLATLIFPQFHNTVDFNKISKKKSNFGIFFSANGNRGSNILSPKNKLSASAWYNWFFCRWRAHFSNSKPSPAGWTWPITRATDHWHLSFRHGSVFWLAGLASTNQNRQNHWKMEKFWIFGYHHMNLMQLFSLHFKMDCNKLYFCQLVQPVSSFSR